MRRASVRIPFYVPDFAYAPLRRLRTRLRAAGVIAASGPTLAGDREIEWSWVASHLPQGPGKALDLGPGGSAVSLIAAERGFDVTAVDLEPPAWAYEHPRIRFVAGDLLKLSLDAESYDVVVCCSTVEHVGLSGRYGVTDGRPDGDLAAMRRLREAMRPDGTMLLTVPVGRDAVVAPLHRIYGERRLPQLLAGFAVEQQEFWAKTDDEQWRLAERETALAFRPADARTLYALGCFLLRRGDEAPQSEDGR